jgi:hypothetical protein
MVAVTQERIATEGSRFLVSASRQAAVNDSAL